MGYVMVAYGISIGAVALYLVRLVRDERRLRRELAEAPHRSASPAFRG